MTDVVLIMLSIVFVVGLVKCLYWVEDYACKQCLQIKLYFDFVFLFNILNLSAAAFGQGHIAFIFLMGCFSAVQ